jgi:fructokinase
MRKVIGIGETVLDVIFKNDQPTAAVPGGSTFNAMISLGRTIGIKYPDNPILMITETGDDHIGDIVVNFMEQNHVSTKGVTRNPGTQSHISMAFLNEQNDAQYEFYKDHKHASLQPEKVNNFGGFGPDDLVLFGSFFAINPVLRSFTRPLLQTAQKAGSILYYDINFRASHIADIPETLANIEENYRLSDVVRGSAEDFGYLYGTTDPQTIYEKYIRQHCPNFICTDGARPVRIFTPSVSLQIPVLQVQTVSTIGAGDNFNAGFLYGLVERGLLKNQINNATAETWQYLIETGQQFSRHVCQSMYNYVDKDFLKQMESSNH